MLHLTPLIEEPNKHRENANRSGGRGKAFKKAVSRGSDGDGEVKPESTISPDRKKRFIWGSRA